MLGFGEDWLNEKIPKGKLFKFAIFPSVAADSHLADWDGVESLVEKHFPEIWSKVLPHYPTIRSLSFAEIQAQADYNMFKTNLVGRSGRGFDTEGESDSPNYISLQRLLKREGTLIEVRQFLWDEIGLKDLYVGNGRTLNDAGEQGPYEYLAKNMRLEAIDGLAIIDIDPR